MRTVRRFALCSFIVAYSLGLFSAGVAAQEQGYRFGVFPFLPPNALSAIFAPMAAEFETALDKRVRFRTKNNLEDFDQAMANREYDIAYINPTQYIRAHDETGYRPVAGFNTLLTANLVVRGDDGHSEPVDLKGRTVGLVGNQNTVDPLSLLITLGMLDNGLQAGADFAVRYYKNPYACLQGVLVASVDACGSLPVALARLDPELRSKYRVIYETESIPHSLIVASPGFPDEDLEALRGVILGWQNTETGLEILRKMALGPFVEVSDQDYDVVRKMMARMPNR